MSDLARSDPSSLSYDWFFVENALKREVEELCGFVGAGRQILVEQAPSINTSKDFSLLDIEAPPLLLPVWTYYSCV